MIIDAFIINTQRNYHLYFELNGYKNAGKILLDQVRAIDSNARKVNHIEKLNNNDLKEVLKPASFIFQE
ncbi:type II toxin-antitoxin system PemK/MazF family toxin [Mycoplasma sp. P36-A1]|uniref:type II toxin-antitoxin system PemK/MazF family toxin n=1 Tax=Mycoplasma sp. P36-A1 TaxID=3252900 RepID=UPI003C2C1751